MEAFQWKASQSLACQWKPILRSLLFQSSLLYPYNFTFLEAYFGSLFLEAYPLEALEA